MGAAPAMEGEGGKLQARMSLAQDSLAASLVDNNHTVAAAVTTLSPSTTTTTTGSTTTSRTRASTTRTWASATRTPGGASATSASPSATRTGTQHGADLVLHHWLEQQLRRPSEVQQIPKQPLVLQGVRQLRLIKNFVVGQYLNSELLALEIHML